MNSKLLTILCLAIALGAGISTASAAPNSKVLRTQRTGTVHALISASSTEDWAQIDASVVSVGLIPQGGGTPVTIYTATTPFPVLNLVQLDGLSALLGSFQVAPGTYTGATIAISANPGDVSLVVSADPEVGFAGMAGSTIASSQIQIQGASGPAGSQTITVPLALASPLVVTGGGATVLNVGVDLASPSFIIDVVPAGGGAPYWAVTFIGTVHYKPTGDLTKVLLQEAYGTVSSVAPDNLSFMMTLDNPAKPVTTPETAVATTNAETISVDAINGTIYYDADAMTSTTIEDFSSLASSLPSKYVQIAARLQDDGALVATQITASASFSNVWLDPTGQVLHVDNVNYILTVENENAQSVKLTVDGNTQFFNGPVVPGSTPIGTGTAFLANLYRGFRVSTTTVVGPTKPLVAQTVAILVANFGGTISNSSSVSFTYASQFPSTRDNYVATLAYISASTPNGVNDDCTTGFTWWDFTFLTLADCGTNAIADFVATETGVSFGGKAKPVLAQGTSQALWNDPANPNGWAAAYTVLVPTAFPRGTVTTGWTANTVGGTIAFDVPQGGIPVTVNISDVIGSASIVYQVDQTVGGVVTVSPVDLTTPAGQLAIATNLNEGTKVNVYGVPQADGSIQAYEILYFTPIAP